jgi:hypothetical protein
MSAPLGGRWFLSSRLGDDTARHINDSDFWLWTIRISACNGVGEHPEVLNELSKIYTSSIFRTSPTAWTRLLMNKQQNAVTSAS